MVKNVMKVLNLEAGFSNFIGKPVNLDFTFVDVHV